MRRRIGILTGGGDVPGLNAAIKAFVYRLLDDEQYEIVGLRRGWAALINIIPDPSADNSAWILPLTRYNTRVIDRAGGRIDYDPMMCRDRDPGSSDRSRWRASDP